MPQSQSLNNALKAAEQVLTASTDDTAELARIAADASKIPVDRILMRIDLTGIDLTHRDVSHLLDKQAHYHGAKLSSTQRRKFEQAERKSNSRRTRMNIRNMRVNAIMDFIEAYAESDELLESPGGVGKLTVEDLRTILIAPIGKSFKGDIPLDPSYTLYTLMELSQWAHIRNVRFFKAFCRLLLEVQAPTNRAVVEFLDNRYLIEFGETLGSLIAQMHPTPSVDYYWVVEVGDRLKQLTQSTEDLTWQADSQSASTPLKRALQISEFRMLHQNAVEGALDTVENNTDAIEFLERVRFECSGDGAERMAARITNAEWPASETKLILKANVHPRVRGALFRQLLHQGNEARVIEILRWLNADKGAVGALSLDNAFRHIRSFSAGLRFAVEASSSFAENQMAVVYFGLRNLARTPLERASLEAFRKGVNYSPPRDFPLQVLRSLGRDAEADFQALDTLHASRVAGIRFTRDDS